jgi:hypothetical protein
MFYVYYRVLWCVVCISMAIMHALCVFVAIMKCCVWNVQVWLLCVLYVYIASMLALICVVMYKYGYYVRSMSM